MHRAFLVAIMVAGGCGPSGPTVVGDPDNAAPTWHDDIAPIVAARCAGCHQAGQVAEFLPLTTPEQATPWAARIAEVVQDGSMPPWGQSVTDACPTPWDFLDDPRPTEAERELLVAWADADTPLGEPTGEPPAPAVFDPLSDANQRLTPAQPFEVPGDVADVTICFVLEPELTELSWLEGVQVEADDARIVHHAGVRLDIAGASRDLAGPDGWYPCTGGENSVATEYLGTFAPGSGPSLAPSGTAMPIPAGSALVLSIHYHPVDDIPVLDQTGLALRWADHEPERVALLAHWPDPPSTYLSEILQSEPTDPTSKPELWIPADVPAHVEQLRVPVPGDPGVELQVWQIAAHMHAVGSEARIVVEHPDGTETCLVHIPDWDFDWQRIYRYDLDGTAPSIHGGDVLRLDCIYDNTLDNAQLAETLAERGLQSPVDVSHGAGTYDEMCMFLLGFLLPESATD